MIVSIRELQYEDIRVCTEIVGAEWGSSTADRACKQLMEKFTLAPIHNPPQFYVAVSGDKIIGFAGFEATSLMNGAYDLIWIALTPEAQGKGVGSELTRVRLAEIKRRGGTMVSLMTEKPGYFERFGFQAVALFDGWHLMVKKIGKVGI